MSRALCVTLSLTVVVSSLAGCSSSPVKQGIVKGPQVFGYTLNQSLSNDDLKAFTNTRAVPYGRDATIYKRDDGQGGVLQVFLDRNNRPLLIGEISRSFATRDECLAALQPS